METYRRYMVTPGKKPKLNQRDPGDTAGIPGKKEAAKLMADNLKRLAELQYALYAEQKQSVLIVLQALDAGGKDGTINHVFSALNPQGCRVAQFKKPSTEELAHDFLWRIHRQAPKTGEIVIFNRSHYEDVLVARVHKLVPKKAWQQRYGFINDFERLLAAHHTTILKFFLHTSKDEQLDRFKRRLEDPKRQWKISEADYEERLLWDDYTAAFEDALAKCSKAHAPWFVIPANHKWFRNLAVSEIMVEALEAMKMKMPEPSVDLDDIRQRYHAAVQRQAASRKKK